MLISENQIRNAILVRNLKYYDRSKNNIELYEPLTGLKVGDRLIRIFINSTFHTLGKVYTVTSTYRGQVWVDEPLQEDHVDLTRFIPLEWVAPKTGYLPGWL